jgi:hypothetical protein
LGCGCGKGRARKRNGTEEAKTASAAKPDERPKTWSGKPTPQKPTASG